MWYLILKYHHYTESKYNPTITILTDITMWQEILRCNKKEMENSDLCDFKIIPSIASGVIKTNGRDFYKV